MGCCTLQIRPSGVSLHSCDLAALGSAPRKTRSNREADNLLIVILRKEIAQQRIARITASPSRLVERAIDRAREPTVGREIDHRPKPRRRGKSGLDSRRDRTGSGWRLLGSPATHPAKRRAESTLRSRRTSAYRMNACFPREGRNRRVTPASTEEERRSMVNLMHIVCNGFVGRLDIQTRTPTTATNRASRC
jgi:hypothetical protein